MAKVGVPPLKSLQFKQAGALQMASGSATLPVESGARHLAACQHSLAVTDMVSRLDTQEPVVIKAPLTDSQSHKAHAA